jgi:hypothetical protein
VSKASDLTHRNARMDLFINLIPGFFVDKTSDLTSRNARNGSSVFF